MQKFITMDITDFTSNGIRHEHDMKEFITMGILDWQNLMHLGVSSFIESANFAGTC